MAIAKCVGGSKQHLLQPKSYRRSKQLCEKSAKINLFITFTILITDKSDIYPALFPYSGKEISKIISTHPNYKNTTYDLPLSTFRLNDR